MDDLRYIKRKFNAFALSIDFSQFPYEGKELVGMFLHQI